MFRVQANTLDQYFNADQERKGDLQAFDALIRETVPDLERWFYSGAQFAARRVWPFASARVIRLRLTVAWRRWVPRNSGVVWKSGQVRQALGWGQSCWGGRPQ
jgi:hypothetical protein